MGTHSQFCFHYVFSSLLRHYLHPAWIRLALIAVFIYSCFRSLVLLNPLIVCRHFLFFVPSIPSEHEQCTVQESALCIPLCLFSPPFPRLLFTLLSAFLLSFSFSPYQSVGAHQAHPPLPAGDVSTHIRLNTGLNSRACRSA